MTIQHWSDDIWVAELSNEPSFSEEVLSLIAELQNLEKMPHVVVDLTRVDRLNSSNISQLLRVRKLAIDKDAKLRLAGPKDAIWAIFITIGIDKIFEFSEDVPSALAAIQMES